MLRDNTISILTPTRNRPNNCQRFIKSIYNTAKNRGNIELFFYVDNDDPSLEAYKSLAKHCYEEYNEFFKCDFTFDKPISVSKSWNIIAEKSTGYHLIMGNDDLIYRTPDWDTKLIQNLAIKYKEHTYWVSWFNDGINGARHCAFPIMSRDWYDELGYFAPGVFHFGYNDTWVFDIAKRLNTTNYIDNILVEHMHFSKGKSEMDDTYARNRTQEQGNLYKKDLLIFQATEPQRKMAADKINDKIRHI